MNLEQQRMEKQLLGARALSQVVTQALVDEVLLLAVLETLDGPMNVLLCDHCAGIAVTLNLKRGHLQRAHAEREDVDGGR